MAGGGDRNDDALTQAMAGIGTRLDARLTDITRSVSDQLVSDIAELRGEEQLQQILGDSVAANIDAFFAAARHGISIDLVHAPAAAIEHALRLAQRDISANVLVRSYRLGQQAVLKAVLEEIRTAELDPRLALDVFDAMSTISFNYIDRISQEVVEVYQQARESWLENRNSVRINEIRELLAGGDVDIDAATVAIRYPLQRTHLAVVLWCDDSEDRLAEMERLVQQFAASIGAADSPLFISVDRATAWAWVAVPAAVMDEAVTWLGSLVPAEGPYVAVGTPQSGVAGFRLSHRQAEDARIVAVASGPQRRRFTAFGHRGVALAALLGSNVDALSAWATEVLGPLACSTVSDRRLRETLQAFLKAGGSNKAAAEELHLHTNSVKYRVQRAIERRGRPIEDDRLDVEVALLLCSQFGDRMLDPADDGG
ncbi:PucR family transcriptional regulator [Mycolicibacterium llatzerense]|uniref:PucR family transcriptional regulator n=1 Tax=Mycolicibacterium llatzerense TaxID=280871 RepID=UPI0005C78B56|nr:helix-turn-helix domain-containing protein [Mycolicibacterium llatzerense]MCT7366594.1 PucR family transcriptional regulator [Mycolicibacterium llatzerense]MCT7371535.1 PucR family transcriptional regulator [Mycolicibacterium llatzerense]